MIVKMKGIVNLKIVNKCDRVRVFKAKNTCFPGIEQTLKTVVETSETRK